jgi:hypothetical protein
LIFDPLISHLRKPVILLKVKNSHQNRPASGPNPTTLIYNASGVKIYNATNSLACFYMVKIIFLRYVNAIANYNAGVVGVNSQVIGVAQGLRYFFLASFLMLSKPHTAKLKFKSFLF